MPVLVSVIIPVLDDYPRLAICLNALKQQTFAVGNFEIIVVDNGSAAIPEQFQTERHSPNLLFLKETRPGSYAARNKGIKAAKGKIIAFTDSDCRPEKQWIESGFRALSKLNFSGIVGGKVKLFTHGKCPASLAERYDLWVSFPQKTYIKKYHFSVTANLFVPKSMLQHVGLFNARLKSGGDWEWGNRAYNMGHTLHYVPETIVYHPARRTISKIVSKARRTAGGHYGRATAENHRLPFNVVCSSFLPPILPVLRVLTKKKPIPICDRLSIAGLMLVIYGVSLLERMRLHRGGSPLR